MITTDVAVMIVIAIPILLYFLVMLWRIRKGTIGVTLRPLTGITTLRFLADRAVEEGSTLHLALGTGSLHGATAAESLMGLAVLDTLAAQAARTGQAPVVTTADPVAMLVAQDQLRAGDDARGWRTLDNARFVAPTSAAYGAGVRGMMGREALQLNALLGHFRDEYLFLAAEEPSGGKQMRRPQVAGTARLESLPLVHLTSQNPIIGEHFFALGAYLGRWPSHLAGLLAQRVARFLIAGLIVAGALLRTFGVL